MTIDQTRLDLHPPSLGKVLKKSHRTRPEQAVGLGIYLSIALGFQIAFPLGGHFFGVFCSILLSLSMWTLWRFFSLRALKLELSIFLLHFLLQTMSFFALQKILLELVVLLLLWCNLLMAILLFWKKERLSGIFLLYPVIWIFYLIGMNMMQCMATT